MTAPVTAVSAPQLLSALLTAEEDAAPLLEVLRPDVLTSTREAYDALFRTEQALPAPVLHALAVVTADWQGGGDLADWHRHQGAAPQLAAADPLTTDLHGHSAAALQALRDHVDLLSISPALATAADHRRLADVGVDPATTVLVSQLVAFESHLLRLLWGLAALHGVPTLRADAPTHPPAARGRRTEGGTDPAATTVTGRPGPRHFTRERLDWEPWIAVPAEDQLTEAQRASFAAKSATGSVYFRMLSLTPTLTAARSALDNAIFLPRDGLPKAERELAATVTSKVNDCIYCASVHARKAAALAKREADVDQLLAAELDRDADWIAADLTALQVGQEARWARLIEAAAELSRPRPALRSDHLAALRRDGLEDSELADLITASAFFSWANRLMLSLGEPSLPDAPAG